MKYFLSLFLIYVTLLNSAFAATAQVNNVITLGGGTGLNGTILPGIIIPPSDLVNWHYIVAVDKNAQNTDYVAFTDAGQGTGTQVTTSGTNGWYCPGLYLHGVSAGTIGVAIGYAAAGPSGLISTTEPTSPTYITGLNDKTVTFIRVESMPAYPVWFPMAYTIPTGKQPFIKMIQGANIQNGISMFCKAL